MEMHSYSVIWGTYIRRMNLVSSWKCQLLKQPELEFLFHLEEEIKL